MSEEKAWYVVLCCESGNSKHDLMYDKPSEMSKCWDEGDNMWNFPTFSQARKAAISMNSEGINDLQRLNGLLRMRRAAYYKAR